MIKTFLLFFIVVITIFSNNNVESSPLETGVMGLSAASSMKNLDDKNFFNFKGIFSPVGEVELEKVVFEIDEDMNEKGAVTVYIVICYDQMLLSSLRTDTASQFKDHMKTYKNDYPDKIVVLKWPIQAKKRVSKKIDISKHYEKDNMTPVGGFLYATYSTPGEHRYKIPTSWKEMKICLKKKECKLEQINSEQD